MFRPFALVLLAATGCGAEEPDTCGARGYEALPGQPAEVLETMRFGGPVRILREGAPMTMDYNPARLNITKDAADRISRVWCG